MQAVLRSMTRGRLARAGFGPEWRQRVARCTWRLLLAVIGAFAASVAAAATDYPNRPVRVVIPFSAGGAPDVVMRVVAQALSEKWGQSVIIENRPGANTYIGTTAVTRSAPDGYTLLFTADGTFILNPLLYTSLPYAMGELAPITLIATTPHLLAIHKDVPAQNVREFVALARTKSGVLTYGSTGSGSIQRLAFEFFSRLSGIELVHVPYRGANETMTALLAGEITTTINGLATVFPHLAGGGVRALAISTKGRSALAPELPTVEEAGVPGYSSQGAFGLLAPVGVPQDVRNKIGTDIAEVLGRPDIKRVLEARRFELAPTGPTEFEKLIGEESEKWRAVIAEKRIKGD